MTAQLALLAALTLTLGTEALAQGTPSAQMPLAQTALPQTAAPQTTGNPAAEMQRIDIGSYLGRSAAEIAAALEGAGYRLREFEHEHGRIEVKAERQNRYWEFKVNPEDGRVTRVEEERS
jgi:hypothetical protein